MNDTPGAVSASPADVSDNVADAEITCTRVILSLFEENNPGSHGAQSRIQKDLLTFWSDLMLQVASKLLVL